MELKIKRGLGREIHTSDRIFYWVLFTAAVGIAVLFVLLTNSVYQLAIPALKEFGFKFFFSNEWDPVLDEYGALSAVFGTLYSCLIALMISVPVAVGAALFLTEVSKKWIGAAIGFLVEMLAAIPSVVYGLWGIFVLTPWLRSDVQPFFSKYFGFLPIFKGPAYGVGMMAAGIILAIMILPTICTITREVFRAIPLTQREAALALGATRWEMMRVAVLGAGKSGILGAVILGFGRALGETMAVAMVIGNRHEMSASLFSPGQTMASLIANEYAEAASSLHLSSLAAVGFGLFVVSLFTNVLGRWVAHRI